MSFTVPLRGCKTEIVSSIIGALAGYLLFHPYAMLVYRIKDTHQEGEVSFHIKDIFNTAFAIFDPEMLPMALSFAFFGGAIGLLSGVIISKQRSLSAIRYENERKKVALETIQRLMVTLSHHLLNANAVIGASARRARKLETKADLAVSLELIEEQARRIDAVIAALRKTAEVKTADYTAGGRDLLIDISKEIEELLQQKEP